MRISDRPNEDQAEIEIEVHGDTKAKKRLSDNSVSNIATLDNGTMVESFKYLNYSQLANSSLVSKRYHDLILYHRHKLALLYVDRVDMSEISCSPVYIKIFNEKFSPDAYNEWIIRNKYSKQIPVESQIAQKQSTKHARKFYVLSGDAIYEDSARSYDTKRVFFANAQLNDKNWPLFQHFARLLTDPFIYIRSLELAAQNDVLNLLADTINSDHNRLQCNVMTVILRDNMQEFISWIKDHVRCNEVRIFGYGNSKCDEEFLDFLMTGAKCTPEIDVKHNGLCKLMVVFVQKFMDLKRCDEQQIIESIRGNFSEQNVVEVKRRYVEFIVKNEHDDNTELVFEFINNDIGKKLQLSIIIILHRTTEFSLKIANF